MFQCTDMEKLLNVKAGIGRTIQELKVIYENNDLDINKFIELLEKYSIRLKMVENEIEKLKNLQKEIKSKDKQLTKSQSAYN